MATAKKALVEACVIPCPIMKQFVEIPERLVAEPTGNVETTFGGHHVGFGAPFAPKQEDLIMPNDTKPHDWNKEQPHRSDNGRITTENYARANPNKVEWVKNKK